MPLTLSDLNFTFDTTGIDDLKTEIANSLQITNYIEETPSILVNDLNNIVDYFSSIFNTNLENFANNMKNYFDQQGNNLKNEIKEDLALDPDTLYDIQVKKAQTADKASDSDKLSGKTINDIITDIITNYVPSATVANSLKFNNKTFDEIMNYIANNVKVNSASNADTFNDMTYEAVKNDILNSISLEDNIDLDTVKSKVENDWTANKAKDTEKFNNYDYDYWVETIIPGIKVDNAINSDKLEGNSYNDIIASINTEISNQIANIYNTDNFSNAVKAIKVDNASNADAASNASKFNNYDLDGLISYIESNATVNEAINASKFDNLTSSEWKTYIQNEITTLQNNLTSGTVIPKQAQEPVTINGIDVSKFDDHINDLIDDKVSDITTNTNASKFNGYTFDDFIDYITENVKVDNATQADSATEASNANKLDNKTIDEIDNYIRANTISQINDEGVSTLNISIFNKDDFDTNLSFIYLYKTLFPNNTAVFPEISSFNFSYQKQTFTYDDNGNVTEIKYFAFDSDNILKFDSEDSESTTPIIDIQYVIQHELYTYDDNGNIIKIQKDLYLLINIDDDSNDNSDDNSNDNSNDNSDDKPYSKLTFIYNYIYDENNNLIQITQETPTLTKITKDDLLTE
jgi:hypothetical protein